MKQKKSLTDWKHMKAEQISTRILYVLVGVTTVLFVLFYLVGYDMTFMYAPEYNAPLFTDVLLSFMYLMVAAAVAVAVFAVVRGYRRQALRRRVLAEDNRYVHLHNPHTDARRHGGSMSLDVGTQQEEETTIKGEGNVYKTQKTPRAGAQHHIDSRHIVYPAGVLPRNLVDGLQQGHPQAAASCGERRY